MIKMHDYIRVTTLEDFEQAVASVDGPVMILAGGSDVLVKARETDAYRDHTFIDVFGIPALRTIEEQGDEVIIRACATHEDIAASPLVKRYMPILAEASRSVGSLQIRQHATIGGNIANASPAADTLAALALLRAEVVILRDGVMRVEPLVDIFERPYKTNLSDRDLIVSVRIQKLGPNVQYDFTKIGRRKALSISRMTIATLLEMDDDGVVTFFDMTMGATFPRPMTFPDISAMLVGKRPTDRDIQAVARALSDKIPEIAGIRKSTAYKQPVCRNLAERILRKLIKGETDDH
ncbi:MAG: FAD binding domain-containing protein [Saccharofermentanales bacterium]|jgi:CO/xanthine dehydrogenase FAD-binding subunit